jgi:hypothetical protein
MKLKNAIAIATVLFSGAAFANQVQVSCSSNNAHLSGVLEVNADNSATGSVSVNGTASAFSGRYLYFPAGTYCAKSAVTVFSGAVKTNHSYNVKSVRGDTCENVKNGDTIYVNGIAESASCHLTKN